MPKLKLLITLLIITNSILSFPSYINIVNNTKNDITGFYMVERYITRDFEGRWGNNLINSSIPSKTGRRLNVSYFGSEKYDIKIVVSYGEKDKNLFFFNKKLLFNPDLEYKEIYLIFNESGLKVESG